MCGAGPVLVSACECGRQGPGWGDRRARRACPAHTRTMPSLGAAGRTVADRHSASELRPICGEGDHPAEPHAVNKGPRSNPCRANGVGNRSGSARAAPSCTQRRFRFGTRSILVPNVVVTDRNLVAFRPFRRTADQALSAPWKPETACLQAKAVKPADSAHPSCHAGGRQALPVIAPSAGTRISWAFGRAGSARRSVAA